MNKKLLIVFASITIIVLAIKFFFFDFESGDFQIFLSSWIDDMKKCGGLLSLKYSFTDYNYPYLILLAIISYIPIKSIYLIKLVSCVFDILLAIIGSKFVYKYTTNDNNKIRNTVVAFLLLSISPIILLNSSVWGQCDSIYAFFSLLSIYYLCEDKITKSFIYLGIAFSFKLQTVFILPVFIIMFICSKRIKIYHFLIIPLVNFIMCIPAYLVGGSPLYTYKTYLFQTQEYGLDIKVNNIYYLLPDIKNLIYIGILVTLFIFACLLLYYYIKKITWDGSKILDLTIVSVGICYFFLPCMHERYSYLLDILSIIWIFKNKKFFVIPIIINMSALSLYLEYLTSFRLEYSGHVYLTVLLFISILVIMIINMLRLNNKQKCVSVD